MGRLAASRMGGSGGQGCVMGWDGQDLSASGGGWDGDRDGVGERERALVWFGLVWFGLAW